MPIPLPIADKFLSRAPLRPSFPPLIRCKNGGRLRRFGRGAGGRNLIFQHPRHRFPINLKGGGTVKFHRDMPAPDFIHQLEPGEDLPGIRKQLIKQQKLLLRQNDGFTLSADAEGIIVEKDAAEPQLLLMDDLRPAQQRLDPQQHLFFIDGLGDVVVCSHQEPLALIGGELPGRYHQDRQVVVCFAQQLCKFIAVHFRHHDIQNNKIHMLPIQDLKGRNAVIGGKHCIILRFQNRLQQHAGVAVVVDNKNLKHEHSPLPKAAIILSQDPKPNLNFVSFIFLLSFFPDVK